MRVAGVSTAAEFSLRLRVPGWTLGDARLRVNDKPWNAEFAVGSYVEICRTWQAGDEVHLHLPMPALKLRSHPYVFEDSGRIALMRGPLVYCVEGADYPGLDMRDLVLPLDAPLRTRERPDLLGGVVLIHGSARVRTPDASWDKQLYRSDVSPTEGGGAEVPFVAVPYYAWAHREPGGNAGMEAWLRAGE